MYTLQKILLLLYITGCAILQIAHGASLKIIGGTIADQGEFPFLVAIQYKGRLGAPNRHNCGGTLVNMTRVITAAHCVHGISKEELTVVAGTHLLNETFRGNLQNRDVRNIVIHQEYVDNGSDSMKNDIAIVDLSVPFEMGPLIKDIRMASRSHVATDQCWIAGWGYTPNSPNYSNNLMKGQLTVNSKEQCTAAYPEFDPDTQICAGALREIVNLCMGDTGGGIYCNDNEGPYLAGVASWGVGCGREERSPGVFMELAKYRRWIDSVVSHVSTTTPVSTSSTTNSPLEGEGDNDVEENANASQPENHKPIAPCYVPK